VSAPTPDHNHPDYGFQRSHCPACGTAFCVKCMAYGDHLSHWPHPRPTPPPAVPGPVGTESALRAAVEATRDLDYDPSQMDGAWVCGQHGVPECTAEECAALSWPEPNTYPTSDFALWADKQFRAVVAPYDRGEVPEMPEEAFRTYSMSDWPLTDALAAALPAPVGEGDEGKEPPFVVHCSRCGTRVSNESPVPLIVRAWVECPECAQRGGNDAS
jgi:hypothetical protein